MNLLLIDDEEYVLESIKKNVTWEKFPTLDIYTALSMKQAKMIMELIPIHIIISDIVMPQGSGFEFISWVREEGHDIQVIFLTSYAEFDYAKRAIALSSVDYLLKPIQYDKLEAAIEKAVVGVSESKKQEKYKTESKKWNENKKQLYTSFWLEVIGGQSTGEEVLGKAKKLQMDCDAKYLVVLIQLHERERAKTYEEWDGRILAFVLGNVLDELVREEGISPQEMLQISAGRFVAVLKWREGSVKRAEPTCIDTFLRWTEEKLNVNIWCGVGISTDICGLAESMESLARMWESSLSVKSRILYLRDFKQPNVQYQNPNLSLWKTLLKEGGTKEIIRGVDAYLGRMENQEMITRDFLVRFRADITQMVYSWLAERQIKAHLLFSGKEDQVLEQAALEGGWGAKKYAAHLVERAVEYTDYVGETESVAEQLRQYIDHHYSEDIHRDELAELVYLNTDYMSRIFKKEIGISISGYLLQKRVDEAKKLLSESDLPINTVSIYVGYSNFSYFTKMFRENTGYSPLEYRRSIKVNQK